MPTYETFSLHSHHYVPNISLALRYLLILRGCMYQVRLDYKTHTDGNSIYTLSLKKAKRLISLKFRCLAYPTTSDTLKYCAKPTWPKVLCKPHCSNSHLQKSSKSFKKIKFSSYFSIPYSRYYKTHLYKILRLFGATYIQKRLIFKRVLYFQFKCFRSS